MTQFDFGALLTSDSGSTLVAKLSGLVPALMTQHSGVARPGYVQPGMLWVDTSGSVWKLNLFDGTSDVVLFTIDPASHARAVAGYAPLASPTFTGDPKAPTPPVGDNDTSLATTAFVQGEKRYLPWSPASLSADTVLDASWLGTAVRLNATGAFTVTLPTVAGTAGILYLVNMGTSATASHTIAVSDGTIRVGGSSVSSLTLRPGEAILLVADGVRWIGLSRIAATFDAATWAAGTDAGEATISPAKLATTIAAQNRSAVPDLIIEEQKAAGSTGTTATAAAWNKRALNTIARNTIGAAVASGVVTLAAGTYYAEFSAAGQGVNGHVAALRDTSGNVKVLGETAHAYSNTSGMNDSIGSGVFTLSASMALELDHYTTSAGSLGAGIGTQSVALCTFSRLNIWKVA